MGGDIYIGPKSGIECLTLVLLEVMGRELQNAETPGVVSDAAEGGYRAHIGIWHQTRIIKPCSDKNVPFSWPVKP